MKINMNRTEHDSDHYKDAVFLSPHKFIGGPGTPGVLVVKKKLLTNRVPTVPGGGNGGVRGSDRAPVHRRSSPS